MYSDNIDNINNDNESKCKIKDKTKNKMFKIKKIVLFLLTFAVVLAPFTVPDINKTLKTDAADTSINGLKKQINDQKAVITSNASKRKALDNEIAKAQSQKQDGYRLKATYDSLIANIAEGIRETEKLIELNDQLMVQTEKEIVDKQAEYDKSYQLFLKMLKFSYEDGNVDYIDMILKSESFVDFLSRMDRISNIVEFNKTILTDLQTNKDDLAETKEALEKSKKQNEDYKAELAAKQSGFTKERTKVENYIGQLDADIEAKKKMQAQIDADTQDIQNEIKLATLEIQRQQALQNQKSSYVGGPMKWPVDISNRVVSSPFGNRTSPITGRAEFHRGIDIPAPYGSNIYAANDGVVIIAKWSNSYGNYIVVDHGGGTTTLYAHSSQLVKSVGAKVYKGDVIAKVGSTGMSTGNHVHFEVAVNGNVTNPLNGYVVQP